MPSVSRRPGRQSAEHQAAVARRLEQLRAELDRRPGPARGARPAVVVRAGGRARRRGAEDDDDPWWSTATRVRGLAPVPADHALVAAPVAPLHASPDDGLERWRSPAAFPVASSASVPGAVLGVPGRHASRRGGQSWRAVVPETLRGRVSLGPAQLTVVVALLCLGLAALAVTAVRGRPHDLTPVAAPVPVAGSASAGGSGAEARVVSLDAAPGSETGLSTAASAPGDPAPAVEGATPAAAAAGATSVTVDVAGKVRRPGIAVLEPGARVVDAIEAAGGAREGVSLTSLNLARPLVDGEQVLVGIDPPPGVAAAALASTPAGSVPSAGSGALVDLNAASEAELDTLPDVGPVTAQSILAWREEHGGFTTVDELLEVDGIGEATLAKLAPHVTV